ncbi:hypothetical protein IA69_20050 [Massilia sp. JS1662]|nr:hypothetical protein [Massilia sp. JS1662]KGF80115.1 hypothetical protein IA69_20050 [Massilia sp. JS1662]
MRFRSATFGAIALCASLASHAHATDDASRAAVAGKFIAALQHQRFQEAAALFSPEVTKDTAATAQTLKRIDDTVGGFSTMQPMAQTLEGKTIRLQVPPRKNTLFSVQKSIQFRYASTAGDGKPVYYEVHLTPGDRPPQVLWLTLQFPAADAQSAQRANRLAAAINR